MLGVGTPSRHRGVRKRWLAGVIAVSGAMTSAVIGVGPGSPADVSAAPAGAAVIDWTMPDRFGGDSNGDGLIDYWGPSDFCREDNPSSCAQRPQTHPERIKPPTWHVDLDACTSAYAEAGATFAWKVVGGTGTISGGPGCADWDLTVPVEGTYKLELTVTSSRGTATVTGDVIVQDWLIISLGDSYGSGEGNPDIDAKRNFTSWMEAPPVWQDRRCQRSAHAGSAQAAQLLEYLDPRTSVTFIHLACSGAEAIKGLLETYGGVDTSLEFKHMDPIKPQITRARELIEGREVDAMYLSVGGNDMNFSRIVKSCLVLNPCNPAYVGQADGVYTDLGMVAAVCGSFIPIGLVTGQPWLAAMAYLCAPILGALFPWVGEQSAERWFEQGLRGGAAAGDIANYRLSSVYRRLADAIHATGPQASGDPWLGIPRSHADRVFISEYVDATQDDEGDLCPKGDVTKPLNDLVVPGLSGDEYAWIAYTVEPELNATVAFNAAEQGWTLVDGIHAAFATHGICADDTYLVGLLAESTWRQDNIYGAVHPNMKGQAVYRNQILMKLIPSLYAPHPGETFNPQTPAQILAWFRDHTPRRPAQAPVADAGGPYFIAEGSTTAAVNGSSDDGPLTYSWESDVPAIATVTPANAASPTITGVDDGEVAIVLHVSDADGTVDTDTAWAVVTNVAPTVEAGVPPGEIDEGAPFTHRVTYTDPGVLDTHEATIDYGDGTVETSEVANGVVDLDHVYANQGTYTVSVTVTDDDEGSDSASFDVTVANVAPTVEAIGVPIEPTAAGTSITATSAYHDPGADSHTVTWTWGDGSTTVESRGVDADGAISATHTYAASGLYTVTLTVDDGDGGVTSQVHEYVVVYDPGAGFVTGGGHIQSPAGALVGNTDAAGVAHFSFVAKYQKGKTVPDGNTSFRFRAGDFQLSSTSYDWLVVNGKSKAQYKGQATVNGESGYGFMLSVIDGDVHPSKSVDRMRLKVWRLADGALVYDNQLGAVDTADASTAISGGQISINGG